MSLRVRLLFLILVSILPLFSFSVWSQITRFRENREASALQAARSSANLVANEIEARIVALRVLAVSPELAQKDFVQLRKRAQAVVDQEAPGANIAVLREDGQHMLNTAVPEGQNLPVRANLKSLKELFRTGAPNVSDVFMGVALKRPVVAIEFPVRSPTGDIIYGMTLNPTLGAFNGVVENSLVSTDSFVMDRAGTIVSRRSGDRQSIGAKVPAGVLASMGNREEGLFQSPTTDGSTSVYAFSKVMPFGWTVAVELQHATLTRAAFQSILPMLAFGGLLITLSVVLSALAAKRISAGLAELRNVSEQHTPDWALLAKHPEIHAVAETIRGAQEQLRERNEELNSIVAQRDLLLREVYHRVKNNLQMIDAMLRRERRRLSDPEAVRSLEVLSTRLHTIGLVHTQLMQSRNLEAIDMADFLGQLADYLRLIRNGTDELRIELVADSLLVTIDFALPVGLLLTEIITNAAKHAAPGGAKVKVAFERTQDKTAVLMVHDSGTDKEAAAKFFASKRVGARIIEGFIKQLDAKMTLNSDNGLLFVVNIPVPETN